jgi:hypothetical protein
MATDMAAKCQAMMADHEKMMAEMKAADQRLDGLIARMNAASGPARRIIRAWSDNASGGWHAAGPVRSPRPDRRRGHG